MRLLLGLVILLALFSAAAWWQRSWTAEARSNRNPVPESHPDSSSAAPGDGWSRVVLGRPSGGEPYVAQPDGSPPGSPSAGDPIVPRESHPVPAKGAETPVQDSRAPEKDATVTVQAGQTLSEICHEHYGTARLELVLAVARYNQLAGPDEIREGQQIRLPPVATIGDGH